MRGYFSDYTPKETLISNETSYSFSIFLLLNLSSILFWGEGVIFIFLFYYFN